MMDLEEAVMGIIVNAGQSRSLCFEALRQARAGQFSEADALLLQATDAGKAAHAVQTKLIEADEGEGKTKMTRPCCSNRGTICHLGDLIL